MSAPESKTTPIRIESIAIPKADGYGPGSFGCHEALHMASVCHGMIDEHLCGHPAIVQNEKWSALAEKAASALFDLYQAIGAEHL